MNIEEIETFNVQNLKQKVTDANQKVIGNVKFKCEKAKNLSSPQNNKIWRESLKNKNISIGFAQLVIDQISIHF